MLSSHECIFTAHENSPSGGLGNAFSPPSVSVLVCLHDGGHESCVVYSLKDNEETIANDQSIR